MDNIVTIIIIAVAALAVGFIIAKMLEKNNAATAIASAKKEAISIIKNAEKDGESLKKDKMLQAKERFIELKSEHEKVIEKEKWLRQRSEPEIKNLRFLVNWQKVKKLTMS